MSKDKTYGVKTTPDMKEHFQQLPGRYGMSPEQFWVYAAGLAEKAKQLEQMMQRDPLLKVIVENVRRLEDGCMALTCEYEKLRETHRAEIATKNQEIARLWSEKNAEIDQLRDCLRDTQKEKEAERQRYVEENLQLRETNDYQREIISQRRADKETAHEQEAESQEAIDRDREVDNDNAA